MKKAIISVISIGIIASLISLLSLANNPPVINNQLTSKVVNSEPIDNITSADNSQERVYVYTTVEGCNQCELVHLWEHEGNIIHRYQTTVRTNRLMKWWTQLPGTELGQWKISVQLNGQEVETLSLDYVTPVMKKQMAPVKSRMKKRIDTECQDNLDRFADMARQNPQDPYYQFMLRKWSNRCSSN